MSDYSYYIGRVYELRNVRYEILKYIDKSFRPKGFKGKVKPDAFRCKNLETGKKEEFELTSFILHSKEIKEINNKKIELNKQKKIF